MDEITAVLKVMLDNYKKGNKWISGADVQQGYEIKSIFYTHVYYPQLSRRISQIKVNLPSGNKLAFDKINNFNNTPYTAYKISSKLTKEDIKLLEEITK